MLPFQDKTLSPSLRARDLCARLTLREKAGQLSQRLYGFRSYVRDGDDVALSDDFCREVRHWGGLGCLYGLYRADPWSRRDEANGLSGSLAVRAYNLAQRYVVEHSRFAIPMLLSSECPHGHQALDGYLLPVNLAVGASFHPDLLRAAGAVCGRQLREMGVNFALVSALDMLRDPRWGRSEECYGEDPCLAAAMAKAIVEGIQSEGVMVVAKHLCAQGETTGGVNASAARIGPRELREIHLPAVRAAAQAGAKGFMAAYNEIDGIPCHINETLLRDILRGEFGFDGVVMADGCALDNLNGLTGDPARSAALALSAGVDISLWDDAFAHLEEAVERGLVSEARLDEAVIRVLTLKFEQGLFEHPYLDETRPLTRFDRDAWPQSLNLSRESLVLLRNPGILPFRPEGRIALIGPAGDDLYRQLGDYTPPVRPSDSRTLLAGLRELAPDADILFDDGRDPARASALAADAQFVILALGGTSNRFGSVTFDRNGAALTSVSMDCGEGVDCATLNLPDGQWALYDAVKSVAEGKLATVIISGRPYATGDRFEGDEALLWCFYPGPWGGQAIAEALLGRISPSGRLPASIPYDVSQLPVYYNGKMGPRPLSYHEGGKYCKPRFAFGEGMGYGKIVCESIAAETLPAPERLLPDETPLFTLTLTLLNASSFREAAVPMLFVTDLESDVARRIAELKAFGKVFLSPGERRAVTLTLRGRDVAVWNRRMEEEVQPGRFALRLNDGAETLWTGEWTLDPPET